MIKSKKHLCGVIGVDGRQLKRIIRGLDSFYYEKKVHKKNKDGSHRYDRNGQPLVRILLPSTGRLKEIQRRIKISILDKLTIHDCVFGGVRGRDSVQHAKQHKGRKFKFTTDLKDFFPSVKPRLIYDGLLDHGFSYDVANIITHLTTYRNQVPQGSPTSTHITNIALARLDKKLMNISSCKDIRYTRYVDDMTFSAPVCFQDTLPKLVELITEEFALNHRKTYYAIGSIMTTGVWACNNQLRPSDELEDKISQPMKFTASQIMGHKAYRKRVVSM